MSLRDQLVAKGFASKKKAKAVDRELKRSRKKEQAERRKKKLVQRETAQTRAAAAQEALVARRERQLQREEAKEQMERALRVRNLILGNQVRAKGPQPFWHPSADKRWLLRLSVSMSGAEQLRSGQLGIAAFSSGMQTDYVLLPESAAKKVAELAPHLIVFLVTPDGRAGEPQFQFLSRTWDTDLRARRAAPTESAAAR